MRQLLRTIWLITSLISGSGYVGASDDLSMSIQTNAIDDEDTAKPTIDGDTVILQTLDKVTARVKTIEVKIGKTVVFETLNITARRCLKTPPEDPPEAVGYLEIFENNLTTPLHTLFQGWMFASNPSLSALEHPVYDIWIKDCNNIRNADQISHVQTYDVQNTADNNVLQFSCLSSSNVKSNASNDDVDDNPPILTNDLSQELLQDNR